MDIFLVEKMYSFWCFLFNFWEVLQDKLPWNAHVFVFVLFFFGWLYLKTYDFGSGILLELLHSIFGPYLQVLDLLLPGLFSFGRVVICFVSFYWKKNAYGMHSKSPQVKKKKQPSWNVLGGQSLGADHQCLDVFLLLFEHCQGNPWQTFHSEAIHCGGGNMILHCHTD